MFHTDITVSRNGKTRQYHAHCNYTSEIIKAVRQTVAEVGQKDKDRGPYKVHVESTDGKGWVASPLNVEYMLTDDLKSAYIV